MSASVRRDPASGAQAELALRRQKSAATEGRGDPRVATALRRERGPAGV